MFRFAGSRRARSSVLVAAIVLACVSTISLVFQPVGAGAAVTPGVPADFTLNPGDVVPKTFNTTLHGSLEAKGNPDECRDDLVTSLTCAAHRLKVNRSSDRSYQLRIRLEWEAVGDAALIQAPDIDMYLFNSATGSLDSGTVGGAGATMPEEILITPDQDEYDIVVQAYAGSITSYKITASYTNSATIAAGEITPDFVLSPNKPAVSQQFSTVLVGQPGLSIFPAGCRGPEYDFVCDVYRVKLNRNKSKEALNFVVFRLDWVEQGRLPDLALVAAGLVSRPLPDLNVYVYDAPEHSLEGVGGAKVEDNPERGGWEAKQDEYDIVVQSAVGIGIDYKLTLSMTDELFDKPFELLDPVTGEPLKQNQDGSLEPVEGGSTNDAAGPPPLALAPIDIDDQIAGIGLGAQEQFDSEELLRLGRSAIRNTAATGKPPSALILWFALLVAPAAVFGFGIVVMRRRHNEAF